MTNRNFYRFCSGFGIFFGLLAIACGCHQIPSNQSYWGSGGDYKVQDETIRRQWQKAAVGSESETPDDSINRSNEIGRLDSFKRFFAKKSLESRQPESLSDDERFFPADNLAYQPHSYSKTKSNGPAYGKTVPIQSKKPASAAAVRENTTASSEKPEQYTAQDSEPAVPPKTNIAETEQSDQADITGYLAEFLPNESKTPRENFSHAVPFFEQAVKSVPQKDAALDVPVPFIENGQTASEMILTSPLAFLAQNPVSDTDEVRAVNFETSAGSLPSTNPLETVQNTDEWRTDVRRAVESLKAEIQRQSIEGTLRPSETARLQLLLLATGDSLESVDAITTGNPSLSTFWNKQCQGLRPLLNEASDTESIRRAAEELAASLEALEAGCPAAIQKALLTEGPASFGQYRTCDHQFHPKDTAHVYLELDHIIAKQKDNQYEIAVNCQWELLNSAGQAVSKPQGQTCTSRSASQLKDIVLNIPAVIPEGLPAGDYTLVVTIRDEQAQPVSEAIARLALTIY